MSIELKMPALSPTMEEGKLARWLVKTGDVVKSGDILAEIETDKATMEFEAVDEGTIGAILIAEGAEGVKVGTVIAVMVGEGEVAHAADVPLSTATSQQAGKSSYPSPEGARDKVAPPPPNTPHVTPLTNVASATPLTNVASATPLTNVASATPLTN
ncbi:MAG: hypothetical protein RLY97_283, partial [Pseudomonadota bacterium]